MHRCVDLACAASRKPPVEQHGVLAHDVAGAELELQVVVCFACLCRQQQPGAGHVQAVKEAQAVLRVTQDGPTAWRGKGLQVERELARAACGRNARNPTLVYLPVGGLVDNPSVLQLQHDTRLPCAPGFTGRAAVGERAANNRLGSSRRQARKLPKCSLILCPSVPPQAAARQGSEPWSQETREMQCPDHSCDVHREPAQSRCTATPLPLELQPRFKLTRDGVQRVAHWGCQRGKSPCKVGQLFRLELVQC
mmetsp:Transcript_47967/g.133290  ORF Transcript_47967/g.133290 Transcript_47967/m.133290 type:complete len:251 (+) Transcript_47967:367-1119(+)